MLLTAAAAAVVVMVVVVVVQGFVVASVEHADGTACCAQLATGEWKFLQGLGTGQVLEAKCDYRVQECLTMAQVLQSMNAGEESTAAISKRCVDVIDHCVKHLHLHG
jgi:hypothetical protein